MAKHKSNSVVSAMRSFSACFALKRSLTLYSTNESSHSGNESWHRTNRRTRPARFGLLFHLAMLEGMSAGMSFMVRRGAPGLGFRSAYRSPAKRIRDAHRAHDHFHLQTHTISKHVIGSPLLDSCMSSRNAPPSDGRSATLHGPHRPEVFIASSA